MDPKDRTRSATPLAAEIEVVRAAYAALNRGDVPAMISAFDPRVEWIDPVEPPTSGTYRGLAAVTAHISESRAMWAEGTCEPERFVVAGDKVVALVRVRVRLKDRSDWSEGLLGDVYTFRDGKVVQGRSFADRRRALEWAGLDGAAAS